MNAAFGNTIMATHRSALHQCQAICEHDGCSSSVLYIFLDISQSLPKVIIIIRRQQHAFLFLAFDKTAGHHCWNILMLALLVYQMVSSRQHLSVIYMQWFSTCRNFLMGPSAPWKHNQWAIHQNQWAGRKCQWAIRSKYTTLGMCF